MNKIAMLSKLQQEKLVAVIRGKNEEQVLKTVEAVHRGGINFIEITFTIPRAQEIIAKLADAYAGDESIVIGAGTCLDIVSARLAISAGAQFVVCPHFNRDIVMLGNQYCIPVFPGATTVKDMLDCLAYGAEIIKLFPGDVMGPSAIKAFKGPLPQAEFMPTGGVTVDNLHQWLASGAIAVGTGSSLTRGAASNDFDTVTAEAKKFVQAVQSYGK